MLKKIHSVLFYAEDLSKSESFYKSVGFSVQRDETTLRAELGGFKLAFIDQSKTPIKNDVDVSPKGAGVFTYVEVDDVDAFHRHLLDLGVKVSSEPKTWPWGKREFAIKDPDGYKLIFFTPVTS